MSQATFSQITSYVYAAGVAGSVVLGTTFFQEGFLSTSRLPSAFYQKDPHHEEFIEILARPWITLALLAVVFSTILLAFRLSVKLFYGVMTDMEASFLRNALLQSTELDFVLLLSGAELIERPTRLHWIAWLGLLCYLDCIQRLGHIRLEYLPPAPITSAHKFSLGALSYSLVGVTAGIAATLYYLHDEGSLFLFVWLYYSARMLFRIGHTLARFLINRQDPPSLDGRHYADVCFKAAAYLLGAVHTVVLLYLDSLESFVSILLLIRMGQQLVDLRGVWTLHNNYLILQQRLAALCPPPTQEQLDQFNDVCPVCRDAMVVESARILPCRHMLHGECLRQWLLQQPSCPVCRAELPLVAPPPQQTDVRLNFNGNRLSPWLPNVSVQVGMTHGAHPHTHPHPHPHARAHHPPSPHNIHPHARAFSPMHMHPRGPGSPVLSPRWDMLEPPQEWVDGLMTMFPDVHPELVRRDLTLTHSLDMTANNILTNRTRFLGEFAEAEGEIGSRTNAGVGAGAGAGAGAVETDIPNNDNDNDNDHYHDYEYQGEGEHGGEDVDYEVGAQDEWEALAEDMPPAAMPTHSPTALTTPVSSKNTPATQGSVSAAARSALDSPSDARSPASASINTDTNANTSTSTDTPLTPSGPVGTTPSPPHTLPSPASSSSVSFPSPLLTSAHARMHERPAGRVFAMPTPYMPPPLFTPMSPARTAALLNAHTNQSPLGSYFPAPPSPSTAPAPAPAATAAAAVTPRTSTLARSVSSVPYCQSTTHSLPHTLSQPADTNTPTLSPSTASANTNTDASFTPMDNRTRRALLAEAAERRRQGGAANPSTADN